MSANGREVAHRVFAAEYDDATHSFSQSDEERAPNYVVTPTGARVNRVFFVGVLTEVESVSDDVLRARVVDPTGAFVVYAGQYQPDEMAFLEDADPPTFVSVTGKARTFSPDDSDRVFTSVRPESVNEVNAETRDRWTVQAAEATLARAATARAAMDLDLAGDALADALRHNGVPEFLADGIPRALDVYGTTEHYLAAVADLAFDALEQVAGEADEVPGLTVVPGDAGDGTVDMDSLSAVEGAFVHLERPESVDEAAPSSADTTAAVTSEDDDGDEQVATATTGTEAAGTEETDDGGPGDDIGDFEPGGDGADADDDGDAAEDGDPAEDEPADDDEPATAEPSTDDTAAEDMPAEEVLDDEERERLEEEYGTFETGTEVGEPGEADIEPEAGPIDPEEVAEAAGESSAGETTPDGTTAGGEEADPAETDAEPDPEPAEEEPAAEETPEPSDEPDADAESADDEDDGAEPDEGTDGDADAVDVEAAVMEWMDDLDDGDGADREELLAAVVDDLGVDPGAVEDAIQDALMAGKCYEPDDAHVKSI